MNNMPNNMSKEKLDLLIKIAAQQMGQDPARLKQQLSTGGVDQILRGLNPSQSKQIGQLLNDPRALEQFLNSPQAKKMMSELLGGR